MSLAFDAIYGAVIGLSLSVWPGEGLSRNVRGVVGGGVPGGLLVGAGWGLANLLAVFAIGAALLSPRASPYLESPAVPIARMLAGVVLVVLGWRLMEDRTPGALHRDRGSDHLRIWSVNALLDRFLATLLAPHWLVLWWLAGAGILLGPAGRDGWRGVGAFAAGMTLAGILVWGGIAAALAESRREWAMSDRVFRIVTALSGLGMVVVGALLAIPAGRHLFLEDLLNRIVGRVFL